MDFAFHLPVNIIFGGGVRKCLPEILKQEKDILTHLHEKLKAYSPQKTLQRGFSLLYNDRNQLIMSYNEVNPGDKISVRVADGKIGAIVTERQGESV